MDGKGGCCIARFAGGGGGGGGGAVAYDTSKMNRILLRYRPIAPKPATSVSVSGGASPEKSDVFVGTGRPKRKYVKSNKKRKKKTVSLPGTETETVVTFPFLPEKPDFKKDRTEVGSVDLFPVDLTVERKEGLDLVIYNKCSHPTVVMPQPVRLVGSCVVVGSVMDGEGVGLMGCTDEERRCNLEVDTCPGFISDGLNRVRWTNEAYRKMVNEDGEEEMVVWLVMEKDLPMECDVFTCRVRLKYTCKKERSSLIVPCDVWRMDGGGFAWRLDVKAALCLGR